MVLILFMFHVGVEVDVGVDVDVDDVDVGVFSLCRAVDTSAAALAGMGRSCDTPIPMAHHSSLPLRHSRPACAQPREPS